MVEAPVYYVWVGRWVGGWLGRGEGGGSNELLGGWVGGWVAYVWAVGKRSESSPFLLMTKTIEPRPLIGARSLPEMNLRKALWVGGWVGGVWLER